MGLPAFHNISRQLTAIKWESFINIYIMYMCNVNFTQDDATAIKSYLRHYQNYFYFIFFVSPTRLLLKQNKL